MSCGIPSSGVVFDIRRTRSLNHKTFEELKRNETMIRWELISEAVLKNDDRNLWYEAKKQEDCDSPVLS